MSRHREEGESFGWHTLDNYSHVQDRLLDDFRDEGFVLDHTLSIRRRRPDRLILAGRVRCRGGLFIDVETILAVRVTRGRRQVRPIRYAFHAGVEGAVSRGIFRYDNSHSYVREGHPDPHHRHRFDHRTWQEITPPEWIGKGRWPQLSDVIEELRQWWETTGQFLDLGNGDDSRPSR
jgi:hypothetical protein